MQGQSHNMWHYSDWKQQSTTKHENKRLQNLSETVVLKSAYSWLCWKAKGQKKKKEEHSLYEQVGSQTSAMLKPRLPKAMREPVNFSAESQQTGILHVPGRHLAHMPGRRNTMRFYFNKTPCWHQMLVMLSCFPEHEQRSNWEVTQRGAYVIDTLANFCKYNFTCEELGRRTNKQENQQKINIWREKKKTGERQKQFPLCKPSAIATCYSSDVQPSVSLAANLRCTWCAFKSSLAQRFWVERNWNVHICMKLAYICFRGEENRHLFEGESFCRIVIGTHNGNKSIRAVISDISSCTNLDLFCGV